MSNDNDFIAFSHPMFTENEYKYKPVLIEIGNIIKASPFFEAQDFYNNLTEEDTNEDDWVKESADIHYWRIYSEQIHLIDELLGAAFVLCQTYITSVVTNYLALGEELKNKTGKEIKEFSKKVEILRANFKTETEGFSPIQIIDSSANYYKHREEWDSDWDLTTNESQRRTIKIIQSVEGVSSDNNINLLTISKYLGNDKFSNTQIFYQILQKWHCDLFDIYAKIYKSTY